ncbi:translation initiation factor IF-3 [Paenarthrobacter sp. Z7-10]|nr:translation initiation factor IF-3 [Paenarthrobacter sp. Z7-10]
MSEPRINDRIRVPEVRLVGPAGEQVGIVRIEDALRLAAESDLDLVEVAPQAKPPVCKLMDFGKYKYEAAVKAREARKNQTNTVLKEIRFRLKIDTHDYETKRGHAMRFLGAGDKVKAMIQFRGREQQRPEMGIRLLQRFADDVGEVGAVESSPRIDGRNMVMVIGPLKNKAEAKAEARRETQRAEAKAHNEAVAAGIIPETKARVDVDKDNKSPLTQSLADLMPTGLAARDSQVAADGTAVPEAKTSAAPDAKVPDAVVAPSEEAPEAVSVPSAGTESVAVAKAPEASKPAAVAKAPEASKPAAVAKAPEASKPAAASKAPEVSKPAAVAKAPEVSKPAAVAKAPEVSKPAAVAKAPEASKPAAVAKAPEASKPAAAAKAPEASKPAAAAVKPAAAPKPMASPKPIPMPKPVAKPGVGKLAGAKPAGKSATTKPAVRTSAPKDSSGQSASDSAE